jgi:hypothetical protein
LSWVIGKHKGSLGEPMWYQYSRELAVGPPRIQDVLCSEPITRDDSQVYKSLHKCEVPAIAELPNHHQNTPMQISQVEISHEMKLWAKLTEQWNEAPS